MIIFFCNLWSNASTLWKNANWKWSECSSSVIPDAGVGGNLPGVDATTLIPSWQEEPWNPYKTSTANKQKKIIKLICKVKNDEYSAHNIDLKPYYELNDEGLCLTANGNYNYFTYAATKLSGSNVTAHASLIYRELS